VTTGEEILDSPTDWVAKHIRSYVESGGKKGHTYYGRSALLLTTRGRHSGKLRRTALYYVPHGDGFAVVGSNGGAATHPQWYLNIRTDPAVYVQVGEETFTARAREATEAEMPELWRQMTDLFAAYQSFQKKTARKFPVVVLERVEAA
jgi:deazaflavin-dependent oxidoreductase (nitroreductase family)